MQKKSVEEKKVTIATTVVPELKKKIELYAQKKAKNPSWVIRTILEIFFADKKNEKTNPSG